MVTFGLIGSGWRAEFYLRIAMMVPERFKVAAVLIRDKEKGEAFAIKFNVQVVNTLEELKACSMDFVVLCVKRGFAFLYLEQLFRDKIPVLCETPPGDTKEELEKIWNLYRETKAKIQVAEQYFVQPLYASWLQAVAEVKIGDVQNINLSTIHGYHAVSIIRKVFGLSFENCEIRGKRYWFDVTKTGGREGMVFDGELVKASRDRITFEFENGKIAFYDFGGIQYHSSIRTRQINIQGTRGEIDDYTVRYLTKENLPVTQTLKRIDLGVYDNQEWAHYGMMLGEEYFYKMPFQHARLNDDEIAIASCLQGMTDYLSTGKDFYSLADALQDSYLSLCMDEALNDKDGKVRSCKTVTQVWGE